jgi:RHS repeat-associated protein
VEESSNTQRTPYLFTGKELDEETGLYYFGARYYDARRVFTSLNLSMYTYSHQSAVRLTDPDGNSTTIDANGLVTAVVNDHDLGNLPAG